MRIIAGSVKGKRLNSPKNDSVRPTTDKVKEAVFSMISEYIEGGVVIDLFAGSGNLGLEALSRGAEVCYFCDNNAESLKLIKSNIDICGMSEKSRLTAGDFAKALGKITERADVIFLDPPYGKGLLIPCFEKIDELNLLSEDGIIVTERKSSEILPDTIFRFNKIKEKKYGTILVSLYS